MKKSIKALIAVTLTASVLLGSGAVAYAAQNKEDNGKVTKEEMVSLDKSVSSNEIKTVSSNEQVSLNKETDALSNDEVVYVFTDSTGSVTKVMDSVWIEEDEDRVQDAKSANLPLDVKVEYKLDGKTVKPDSLKGKSGHLEVKVSFDNKRFEYKEINGQKEKVYVPFLASTVTALDNEKFSNVSVSNGRVVYDGARYAVVGLALPGLKEDLNLDADKEEVKIPEEITMEADVKDFDELGLYLLVSNSVFSSLDFDATDKMEELQSDLSKIDDAMNALINGSDEMYKGLLKLSNGAGQLNDGIIKLYTGLDTIDSNSDDLVNGAKEVFNTLLKTASSQLAASGVNVGNLTIDNYSSTLNSVISGGTLKNQAREKISAEVKKNEAQFRAAANQKAEATVREQVEAGVRATVEAKVTEAVKAQVEAAAKQAAGVPSKDTIRNQVAAGIAQQAGLSVDEVLADPELSAQVDAITDEKISEANEQINQAVEAKMASDEIKATIEAKTNEKMASDEVKAQIEALVNQNFNSPEVQTMIDSGVTTAMNQYVDNMLNTDESIKGQIDEGNKKIAELKASLDNYNKFYQGIIAYTDGVGQAKDGAKKISDSMPELINGIATLTNGGKQLSDGLNQFNDEGIVKLNDIVNTTLEGMVERFDTVKEVSKDYDSYAGEGETKESVKFVYKIESAK